MTLKDRINIKGKDKYRSNDNRNKPSESTEIIRDNGRKRGKQAKKSIAKVFINMIEVGKSLHYVVA